MPSTNRGGSSLGTALGFQPNDRSSILRRRTKFSMRPSKRTDPPVKRRSPGAVPGHGATSVSFSGRTAVSKTADRRSIRRTGANGP